MYTCTIHEQNGGVKVEESKATRNLVAQIAGVSSATVSRVYNHPEQVSPQKVDAVLQAAARLGYAPNKSASALRRSGTGTIGLIEIEKPHRSYYWGDLPTFSLFYTDALKGVTDVLDQTPYHLQLETLKHLDLIGELEKKYDGVIFFDLDTEQEFNAVRGIRIPSVIAHHTAHVEDLISCSTDNRAGGRLQAQMLSGHRPVYLTAFLDEVRPHRDRLDGFCETFPTSEVIVLDDLSEDSFDRAARTLLGSIENGCDGVAAVNDMVLLRCVNHHPALIELLSAGLPAVGYDAAPFQQIMPFDYRSVDLRPFDLYREAAHLLLGCIRDPDHASSAIVEPCVFPR
jgi:LacI family transcriptional regulator